MIFHTPGNSDVICSMLKYAASFFTLLLALYSGSWGQSNHRYDLKKCIEVALKNNIDIQLGLINENNAEINYQQSLWNLAPSLSANGGQFYQSGRSIDRFSNQFVQKTVGNSSVQIQSNWLLYAGGSIRNTIKQRKKEWEATGLDFEQMQQNVALNVALAYLQCMQSKEAWAAQKANSENSTQELKRVQKLYQAGATNIGSVMAARAQEAQAKAQAVQGLNAYKQAILALKNLMQLDYLAPFELMDMQVSPPDNINYPVEIKDLIDSALEHRPDYKAAQKRVESSEYALKVTKGNLLPTLAIGANMSSVYSDNAVEITGVSTNGTQPIGFVQGTNYIVEAPVFDYSTQTINFGTQMRDNFGQSFGATLSMPLFNGLQSRNNVKLSSLAVIQNQQNLKRIKQGVVNDVVSANQNFTAAANNYQAMLVNHEAQKQNLAFLQKQFEVGQVGFFEVQQAKNSETNAYQNLLSAKYEVALREIILSFITRGDINQIN